ncbi:MAG: LptF/LptG family permease [Armatimonadetes bacterium]|nr:LptF/LptG family permease [Armatimonadota bacterium]
MRRLDRYILGELGVPLGIGVGIALMLLIGTVLFSYLDEILARRVPVLLVARWMALRLPELLVNALPMAMAFAVALGVNRLAHDSEVTPMRMAGVSFRRIASPLIGASLVASLAAYGLAEKVVPSATCESNRLFMEIWLRSPDPAIQQERFLHVGRYHFYIGEVVKEGRGGFRLQDVLIYESATGSGYPVWYFARSATVGRRRWVLRDVVRRDIGSGGLSVHETRVPELTLDLERDVDLAGDLRDPQELSGPVLRRKAEAFEATGSPELGTRFRMIYHLRLAVPLACLVFGAIAAPVGIRFSRGGTFVGVLVSIAIGFLYWNAMFLARVLGGNGTLPAAVAAWLPNGVGAVAAVWLIGRADR